MASQPTGRDTRRVTAVDTDSEERRGWLSHGLAALGISALGLAIAGSLQLTTSAQPLSAKEPATSVAAATPKAAATKKPGESDQARSDAAAVGAFAPRGGPAAEETDNAALRTAVLKEQAAQRAEELAKGADDITRAASSAVSDARQSKLTAADRASREAAARLNEARIRRAVAARVAARIAAEAERAAQERTESTERSGAANRSANRSATRPTRPASESGTSNIPSGGGAASPVPGAVIGSHFGQYGVWSRYHTGLDFRAAYGTPIRAVKAGQVLFAGNSGNWAGNHVAIRHGDGRTTMSSHMSSMSVRSGQTVRAGQIIGYVGQTGRAFGAHLHFELYPAGVRYGDVYKAINPQPWLAANGVRTN
ncbi:MAG TPA: M23 family metallopeptidase [Propionibacteriaceae bacterium]|nr:M23 family metallopeptidase [Propionibacteriaceae bacterium]